jgi:hypothetical protein
MSGRKPLATSADQKNTRAPNGSVLTYGFVGSSSAAMNLLAVAGFYEINLQRHGIVVASATSLAFAGGIAAHFIRTARHRATVSLSL